jgi:predicted MFS family arabinose efflux permease
LAAVQFTLLLDFMILMPLGPEIMQGFRLSPGQFATLVSSYTFASALVGLSGLLWLDRYDRKPLLLLLYAVFVAATLACGLARGPGLLLVARLIAGAAAGLVWPVMLATIVDSVPGERRGRAIGVVMTAYSFSAVAGVPLGLWLSSQLGFRAPFYALFVLGSALWFTLLGVLPARSAPVATGSIDRPPSVRSLWSTPFVLGWVLTFTVVFAAFLLIPYLGAFMLGNLGITASELPWVYLCGGAATLVSSRAIGELVDRKRPAIVLATLLVGTIVPHLWLTHLRAASLPLLAFVFVLFMTLTSGRIIPTLALITARIPPRLRERYLAVNSATSDAASGLAAWLGGTLLGSVDGRLIGFHRAGVAAVCVTLLALCMVFLHERSATQRVPVWSRDEAEPSS